MHASWLLCHSAGQRQRHPRSDTPGSTHDWRSTTDRDNSGHVRHNGGTSSNGNISNGRTTSRQPIVLSSTVAQQSRLLHEEDHIEGLRAQQLAQKAAILEEKPKEVAQRGRDVARLRAQQEQHEAALENVADFEIQHVTALQAHDLALETALQASRDPASDDAVHLAVHKVFLTGLSLDGARKVLQATPAADR
eukprot:TRINITY_DN7647_c0_g1_i1.p2 TRINITY_DN7647_c0_g1~~TRINITY_DN7647_c0_g1_i1.p2  ORF type:complete len:193 (-),score=25.30 TRINITY_DN7647_c0_g1_i1:548-1126(-)